MKFIKFLLLFILLIPSFIYAQERKYSTFYDQRNSLFEKLPISPNDIVFLGNSITNGAEWSELFDNKNIKNRGISGDISAGVLDRVGNITKGKPNKIFLMIGINDIAKGISVDSIQNNIERIILNIQRDSPKTRIYLQSTLPVNSDFNLFQGHMKPDSIISLNKALIELSNKYNCTYIDLYSKFVEQGTNKLNLNFTNDGLHMLGVGYLLWRDILISYIKE